MKLRQGIWIAGLCAAFAMGVTALGAEEAAPATVDVAEGALAAKMDSELRAAANKGVYTAVIVEKDGKIILKGGYGWANKEDRIPFTAQTIAQIGSLTKSFTAMAILKLHEEGKLEFDKPAGAYLPGLVEPAASVTLHQLLTHSSGLTGFCGDDFEPLSKADLLSECAAKPLNFEPGDRFHYSNPGYSILAAIVEEISGQALDAYLKENILVPLGMNETGYAFPGVPLSAFAVGYRDGVSDGVISENVKPLGEDYWNLKGNGGMQASSEDMYRWYRAIIDENDVLTDDMRALAVSPKFNEEGAIWQSYGFAMEKAEDGSVKDVNFAGSDGVFLAFMSWRPAEGTFMYIVGNTGERPTAGQLFAVRRMLIDAATGDEAEQ